MISLVREFFTKCRLHGTKIKFHLKINNFFGSSIFLKKSKFQFFEKVKKLKLKILEFKIKIFKLKNFILKLRILF